MITIIHGSDTSLSRKYFLDEKQKVVNAVLLDAEQVNLTDLTQVFEGGGLFGESKFIFIEQLLTKRKKSTDLTGILTYLEKNATGHTIFLWEGKELDRGTLTLLKNPIVKIFKLPQTLFQLLDAILPGNGKTLIKLYHQTLVASDAEMVFYMLIRQIRILLAIKRIPANLDSKSPNEVNTPDPIDEVKRIAPWQKNKLENQANHFEVQQLLTIYSKLFTLEVGQKTGTLAVPLSSAIDFLFMEV